VVYGGENDPTDYLDENTAGYGDEDDKLHLFNDLCLLEPDMRLWVTVPITGTVCMQITFAVTWRVHQHKHLNHLHSTLEHGHGSVKGFAPNTEDQLCIRAGGASSSCLGRTSVTPFDQFLSCLPA